jgi:dTDP-4-dehydrorhamnose reductase
MKILITGGSGVVGSRLARGFCEVGDKVFYTFLSRETSLEGCEGFRLDVTERQETLNLIQRLKPDVAVHTVALTDMDLCETNPSLAKRINVDGTRNVVDACRRINCKVVYISTSNVFGSGKGIFSEEDVPRPINCYGNTKLEGEKITASSGLPFLVIRTDHPYGWVEGGQRKNFVVNVLEKLEARMRVTVFVDWYNRPTFLDDLVDVMKELVKRGRVGIYHVVGSDFINRFDWALKIAEVWGRDRSLIEVTRSDKMPAKRSNANLDNAKAQRKTGIRLLGVKEGLKIMQRQKMAITDV